VCEVERVDLNALVSEPSRSGRREPRRRIGGQSAPPARRKLRRTKNRTTPCALAEIFGLPKAAGTRARRGRVWTVLPRAIPRSTCRAHFALLFPRPGAYTAKFTGANATIGVALVEVYELP